MIITDPRPMSSAPLDGTPVRLFVSAGFAIASFWGVERCQEAFGDGDYRGGWFLLHDDAVEVDGPIGWEPLIPGGIHTRDGAPNGAAFPALTRSRAAPRGARRNQKTA